VKTPPGKRVEKAERPVTGGLQANNLTVLRRCEKHPKELRAPRNALGGRQQQSGETDRVDPIKRHEESGTIGCTSHLLIIENVKRKRPENEGCGIQTNR